MFKYLFYDIIPEIYNIKWYKNDFNSKLDYYYWLPFRYLFFLIISLFDIRIVIYRILFSLGFMKGLFKGDN